MYTCTSCFYALFASAPTLLRVLARHYAEIAARDSAVAQRVAGRGAPLERSQHLAPTFASRAELALAIGAFVDVVFGTMLLCFASLHLKLAACNETSVENGARAKRFSLGWQRNMESIFGKARGDGLRGRWRWFVPLYFDGPAGDGVHWATNDGVLLGSLDFEGGAETWGAHRRPLRPPRR